MVAWKTLVSMIAILAAFLILIFAVVYPFMIAAKEAGESGVCGLQLYLLSVKQKVSLGLALPKTPAECRAQVVRIDEEMVEQYLDYADEAFKRYEAEPEKYAEVLSYFDTNSEASKWEWAVDKIFADKLFDCWAFKAIFGSLNTIELLADKVVCLECSLIQFKDADLIKKKIGRPKMPFIPDERYIGSLGAFMRAESRGYGKDAKTYYEWLNNKYQYYPLIEVPYMIDKFSEYAIIYVMTQTPVDIDFGEGVKINHQKAWMSFLPSGDLTSDTSYFGRVHNGCEGGILGT